MANGKTKYNITTNTKTKTINNISRNFKDVTFVPKLNKVDKNITTKIIIKKKPPDINSIIPNWESR
jgi:hypothetical protein